MLKIDLEKIHKIQIELAIEVKRICEKNRIDYFLIAGTLLGAVRHKGFIPWDDDMDIGMLREDYEKFLKACETDLSSDYYLQTWYTDSQFGLPIAKIRKNATKFVEKTSAKNHSHKGIYIDIFPYDNVPDNSILRKKHKLLTYFYKRLVLLKSHYYLENNKGYFKRLTIRMVKLIVKFIPKKYLIEKYNKQILKYNKDANTQEITIFGGAYSYKKESIRREWITNYQSINFESVEFNSPKDAHLMLKSIYGDYMSLPPKDERYNRHDIIEVDYGEVN